MYLFSNTTDENVPLQH